MRRVLPVLLLTACAPQESEPLPIATWRPALSIEEVAMERCDTPPELVDGLSRQLVDAINCLRPGTLADIPLGGDIRMLRDGRPSVIDGRGLDDLVAAAADGDRQLVVRWAYRDVALQHLFWLQDDFRNCAVAAPAGLSNHQNGLAADLNDWQAWAPVMARHGWENRLPNDRVHFDYQRADDVGLGALSLLAFQALWNHNRPDAELDLSAELDGDTYAALSAAPIEGFDEGLCAGGPPPVGPGPVRGPTVAQSAWRGCEAPGPLLEGLSVQVVTAMNCLQPGALVPLRACAAAGCLAPEDDVLAWLGAPAHTALIIASRAIEAPIEIHDAFRDVALQHFLASAANNIGCSDAAATARSVFNTGGAVRLRNTPRQVNAARAQGFTNDGTGSVTVYRYAGPDADDLTALGVLAFQTLWNRNRPDDPLEEDGLIGPLTRGAIDRAPIAGFAEGVCGEPPPAPDGGPDATLADAAPVDADLRDADPDAPDRVDPDVGARDATAGDARVPTADGTAARRLPPAPLPGWTAVGGEDGGCRQSAPGPTAGWWLLLLVLRRRLNAGR